MERANLGKTGLNISRVIFGGIVTMEEEQNDANRFVTEAMDRGINYYDVAPSYGDAQLKLGNALIPYRNQVYLACKTGERSKDGARRELEESMRLLHTDHFDVYQMHAMTTPEDVEEVLLGTGALETFVWAKKEGYIRNIGFSAHNEQTALRLLELFPFDTVLFPVNWALSLGKDFGNTITKVCKQRQIGLLGMKTIAHRMWRDDTERKRFPKSWCKTIYDNERLGIAALKYTLSLGADAVVPPGNDEQFSFVVNHIEECLANPLSAADITYLKSETALIGDQFIF